MFEVPIADPASLETLNFSQAPATGEPPAEAAGPATGSCTGSVTGSRGGACASRAGFRRLRVSARGRKLRFSFATRVKSPVTVAVFQSSVGRRVVGNRRVARFTGRRRSFTWSGRGNRGKPVRDGFLFARVRVQVAKGVADVRRVTLRRRGGRFTRVGRSFYRRRSCGLLTEYKLGAPVFGGRRSRALRIAFRLSSPSRVTIQLRKGGKVVKRFVTKRRPLAPDLPAAGLLAAARAGALHGAAHCPPRRAEGDLDAAGPPPLTRRRTLTQLCQGSLHSPEEWMR